MTRSLAVAALVLAPLLTAQEPPNAPWVNRLEPFGAAQGETVEVRIVGERLDQVKAVEFDSDAITWLETLSTDADSVRGKVRIAPDAPLGGHIIGLRAGNGRSNSRLFYVDALPSSKEAEPNDTPPAAQSIDLKPQVIQGALPDLPDRDYYRFEAKAGERWVFDLRSIEYGGFLECDISLLDAEGKPVDFSDDRDDYVETPTLQHVFDSGGVYYLEVDQYRGPQRVDCNENCSYMLRISQAPILRAADPLGARRGVTTRVSVRGDGLGDAKSVRLVPARNAEFYRLTFPNTMDVRAAPDPDPATRIDGKITARSEHELQADFDIPADAEPGLWRLWVDSPGGPADGLMFEIGDLPELSEGEACDRKIGDGPLAVNGSLDAPGEQDIYVIQARAGRPIHASVLAVQMGLPYLDPVLELFGPDGELLAEHDDLMSGQGTVIGNLDSSLYYTPEQDGELRLNIRDRIGRGGSSFTYRLKFDSELPGFSLITDAENPQIVRGKESQIGVLLIRDPGFEQAVKVWVEDPPPGLTFERDGFRADQFFGRSADGDNVIIPDAYLKVTAAADAPLGAQKLRILGESDDGRRVEAYSTLWIGPPRKRNDVRRPLPAVVLTVLDR